jgi:hypothetical protein
MNISNSTDMQSSEILENLSQLDGDLLAYYGLNRQFEITIVGSGALIMLGVVSPSRRTTDIDVLEAPNELSAFFEPYQMNTLVETFLYAYPDTWRKRKQKLAFSGDCLTVYSMSVEDLAVLKLLAFRKRDQEDLIDMAESGKLDWILLDALILDPSEVRINLASEDVWTEFCEHYEWLKQKRSL